LVGPLRVEKRGPGKGYQEKEICEKKRDDEWVEWKW
jgi:hypothetical protein